MRSKKPPLSRREREIMDIVYELGRASVQDVQERLNGEIGYSATRAMMRVMEEKGHLKHQEEGQRYVYLPTEPASRARTSALQRLIEIFFGGSKEKLVATLLTETDLKTDKESLERLEEMIRKAKEEAK